MTSIEQYDYRLPKELIAQEPLEKRADARLLVVDRKSGQIEHRYIRDLPEILQPTDHLVLNNTKVVPARLVGRRTLTGGRWQGLYLESDINGHWLVLAKTRGKIAAGEMVTLENRETKEDISLRLVASLGVGMWAVEPESSESTLEILERVGRVPLPHYIREGEMMPDDWKRYQTVFAEQPGAVAAPTAGLHFSTELLKKLTNNDLLVDYVTLHVGIGTFRPVSVDQLDEHVMHKEWGEIREEAVERILETKAAGGRNIAVGTTVARVMETAARSGELQPWRGQTDLFIRPPFEFHAVDALLTNFHLPKSTLLILVRTFGGEELMREAYAEAIREEYRFYSYGDAMLIL